MAGTAANIVHFAIGLSGTVQTIDLSSPLPALTRPAFLDGWSQGGTHYGGPPLVVLNGAGAGGSADGLEFDAGSDGSEVRGLVIGRFGGNGIEVHAAGGVLVAGNYLGTGADGSSSFGNLNDGILIDAGAAHNTVGPGNVISGNGNVGLSTGNGVELAGAGTSGNVVLGNLIGTDKSGTLALGNVSDGILIDAGARANTVGGTAAGSANVICGGFNLAGVNGGSSQAGAVFSLGAPTFAGNVARFDVEVTYSDTPPSEMVFLGVDPRNSSSALAPINSTTGQPDYSAFNFIPSSSLGLGWAPVNNTFSGEFLFQTPPPPGTQPPSGLRPNATYLIGTLTYDLSRFGIQPSQSLVVSIEGSDTSAGTEAAGNPSSFDFIPDNFAVGEQALEPGASSAGVEVAGAGTGGNVVSGNLIGTNPQGTALLGHLTEGVLVHAGATQTTVGGTSARAGNVIAGNDDGVTVSDSGTSGNLVQGNRIGTDQRGSADLGNTLAGVLLENGTTSDLVGGTAAGSGNAIAFNGEGVVVGNSASDTGTAHDSVLGNTIFGNAGLGIDLGSQGTAVNGANPRAFPNDGQNAPEIAGLTRHSVSVTLTSVPNTPYRIEIFASPVGGPAAQAQFFLGAVQITIGRAGVASVTVPVANLPLGMVVTATATNVVNGDTSAVSPAGTQLLLLSNPVITSGGAPQVVTLSAQLISASKPVTMGQVTFTIPGLPGRVTGTPNANGVVTVRFLVPAGVVASRYTILATFPEGPEVAGATAADLLTVLSAAAARRRPALASLARAAPSAGPRKGIGVTFRLGRPAVHALSAVPRRGEHAHAMTSRITSPCTSVRRMSRPPKRNVSRLWSTPSRCSMVACRS